MVLTGKEVCFKNCPARSSRHCIRSARDERPVKNNHVKRPMRSSRVRPFAIPSPPCRAVASSLNFENTVGRANSFLHPEWRSRAFCALKLRIGSGGRLVRVAAEAEGVLCPEPIHVRRTRRACGVAVVGGIEPRRGDHRERTSTSLALE